jgi:hypothetical protein
MSPTRFRFQPQAVTEIVWGPAWPLLLVLLGFPGLLFLLAAATTRADLPLFHGFFSALAVGSAAIAISASALAVHRQAHVQRIWASRLAPRAADRRVSNAVGHGLRVVWAITALPLLLLGAAQRQVDAALAAASLLAALMLVTAAWACAWQGRLSPLALAPLALVAVLALAQGPSGLWVHWSALGAWAHGTATLGAAMTLPHVLAANYSLATQTPAMLWARLWEKVQVLWQSKYRRVREPGEDQKGPWWAGAAGYPILSSMKLGPIAESSDWVAIPGALTAGVFLLLAYANVVSADLHWRQWLAPGAHLRKALGWRVLAQSFVAHARVGLVFILVVTAVTALWPWGDRSSNLSLVAEGMAAFVLFWLLALPAAVWLRGWKVSPTRRFFLIMGLLLSWLGLSALLVWAGVTQRGELLLYLVAINGLAMLPSIRLAWQQRDLADFMPQRNRNLEEPT